MRTCLLRLWKEDEGGDLAEYALLLFLVCTIAVAAMRGFASSVTNMYSRASHRVVAAAIETSGDASSLSYAPSSGITTHHKKFGNDILSKTVGVHPRRP